MPPLPSVWFFFFDFFDLIFGHFYKGKKQIAKKKRKKGNTQGRVGYS
jgi:hypothetical protein